MILLTSRERLAELFTDIETTESVVTVTFLNPFSYKYFRQGKNESFDYIFSDGMFLTSLNNCFSNKKIKRASFDYSSIANDFFEFCSLKKYNISIVGAKDVEIEMAIKNIRNLHPNLNVAHYRNGYFSIDASKEEYMSEVRNENIDVVVVGMGSPLQDDLAIELANFCPNLRCVITCGGFITQTSIREDYYLPIVKKLGLRWLQRFILHSHVRRKMLIDYPIFIFLYIIDLLKVRLSI